MATHLDLEEQEQLDQLKHFWKQYGNLISWLLIVVLGGFAAWNGWQYWQRQQATQASAMYDELERMVQSGDAAKVERAFNDMKDRYGSTTFAWQGGLMAAMAFHAANKTDNARAALSWVVEKSSDEAYRAIARLRLAALLAEAKTYDQALAQLGAEFPAEFAPLVADRKGDILALQGKKLEARALYEQALKGFDARTEYRRIVQVKLDALGASANQADAAASAHKAAASTAQGNAK